jgi:hypothetical protein
MAANKREFPMSFFKSSVCGIGLSHFQGSRVQRAVRAARHQGAVADEAFRSVGKAPDQARAPRSESIPVGRVWCKIF